MCLPQAMSRKEESQNALAWTPPLVGLHLERGGGWSLPLPQQAAVLVEAPWKEGMGLTES
jgi:hypothetical protein